MTARRAVRRATASAGPTLLDHDDATATAVDHGVTGVAVAATASASTPASTPAPTPPPAAPADGASGGESSSWPAAGCVVLSGGPADGWWFHESDWQQHRTATTRMAAAHRSGPFNLSSWSLMYESTDRVISHHRIEKVSGRVWRWAGPPNVRSLKDLKDLKDAGRVVG